MVVAAGGTNLFTLAQRGFQGLMIHWVHPKTHKINLRGHEMTDGRRRKKRTRSRSRNSFILYLEADTAGNVFTCVDRVLTAQLQDTTV